MKYSSTYKCNEVCETGHEVGQLRGPQSFDPVRYSCIELTQTPVLIGPHHTTVLVTRDGDAADIRYAESSMRNGYGLKYIHKFFNLPFLQLQVGRLKLCSFDC